MRKRTASFLIAVLIPTVAFSISSAGAAGATTLAHERRDVTINRTLTQAESGPFAGDLLTLWGSGTFDINHPQRSQIRGSFKHTHPDGTLVAKGYWIANKMVSFTSYGHFGLLEGGELVLRVTFHPDNEPAITFNDFAVFCLIGSPPPDVEEGVTIASAGFTHPIDGPHRFTLFERI